MQASDECCRARAQGANLRRLAVSSMIQPAYKRRDALLWMCQLASALAYLHSQAPKARAGSCCARLACVRTLWGTRSA